MQMEAGLDSGPIWHTRSTPLGPNETGGTLTGRLSVLGAEALLEALPRLSSGATPLTQDEAGVTLAPKIDRAVARIDWNESAEKIAHHVAAFDPVPGAWTTIDGVDVKLFRAGEAGGAGGAGVVFRADDELHVGTGEGVLSVGEVQPAGKKRQPVAEWVRGRGVAVGAQFT
jgi:methionyl-tRNA formyltransferase